MSGPANARRDVVTFDLVPFPFLDIPDGPITREMVDEFDRRYPTPPRIVAIDRGKGEITIE